MRSLSQVFPVFGVALLLVGPALAQPGPGAGFGGPGMLLMNSAVQQELKLTQDQQDKLRDLGEKMRPKMQEAFSKLRDAKPEERREKMQAVMKPINDEYAKVLGDILKPEQSKRLKQIELQQRGAEAFADPDIQKALKLTDEQKDDLKKISDEARKDMRDLFQGGNREDSMKKIVALRKDTSERAMALLTPEQKKAWKELTGEPIELRLPEGQPGKPGAPARKPVQPPDGGGKPQGTQPPRRIDF